METYPAEYEYDESPCVVKIEGSNIRIEYKQDGVLRAFVGKEEGQGHYRLKAESHQGRGTLHLFPGDLPDDAILEGYYYEDKSKGMWRIHLE